jgi:D-galacturonate reductase
MKKTWDGKLSALLVGGGMISQEVILPTLFQEQRRGKIGPISVSALNAAVILNLRKVFPDKEFRPYPDPAATRPQKDHPTLYLKALDELEPRGVVIVATPDHFHTPVILAAMERDRHVIVQKPLCLKVEEAHRILDESRRRGLYVYTDYHKRHDRAVRAARYRYRKGDLGEMLHGHAWIEEKKAMSVQVFKDWCEKSSPFEYVGVHYVDAYYFITGLRPRRLVAFGQKKFLPSVGKDAFDAVQATIQWEDGSVLFVQTSWVSPDSDTAWANQGLELRGTKGEYFSHHKDRNTYFVTDKDGFEHYNPNFFKPYDDWDCPEGVEWVGYGRESLVQGLDDIARIERETGGLPAQRALHRRRQIIAELEPLRPLPPQALIGTAVNEAVRLSIANDSRWVGFDEKMLPRVL